MECLPKRKPNRLRDYDYSQNGVYFLTVCANQMQHLFSQITVGTSIARPPELRLTPIGQIVEDAIQGIPRRYESVSVDHYVIMPNHVHMLLRVEQPAGRPMVVPTVSRVIQQMKGYVTKRAGKPVWQNKYYDHIIRDEYDYRIKYQYIDENPVRWLEGKDEYL